jgi:hypothetical protein
MHLEVSTQRIKNSPSNSDVDKEGVRLEMSGGRDPFTPSDGKKGVKQKAIVELLCNRDKTGWEPEAEPNALTQKDEEEQPSPSAMEFVSYGPEAVGKDSWEVLRLKWETKYACEDAAANIPTEHWGFFTWVIIL